MNFYDFKVIFSDINWISSQWLIYNNENTIVQYVIKLQWVKIRTHKHITTLKRYLIYLPLQESYKQFFFLHYKRVSQSDHDFVNNNST